MELVNKIIEENPKLNSGYLEVLADYLILCMEKQEKKERKILTDNRLATVNKRETSFEGLVAQLENGEDGIYNMMHESKTVIFQPKISITKKDLEEIEPLRKLRETIDIWEEKLKHSSGKNAYLIKKALIEMRKDQYIIKNAFRHTIKMNKITHSVAKIALEDSYTVNKDNSISYSGISLCNPKVCSAILCNYSKLKAESDGNFNDDLWYIIAHFEQVCDKALKDFPLYQRIIEYKIDGLQNNEIQRRVMKEFDFTHSIEYISSLWRRKIPLLIASEAENEILDWHFLNVEKGKYKRCSRCGQIKLAHSKFFSKNKTSKDGFYSICKKCRNLKLKGGR